MQPIVPDGCVEIVLNLGEPFVQARDSAQPVRQPLAMLVGQLTRPTFIGPSGVTLMVGIRFLPWGASEFLQLPILEIRDTLLALGDVIPGGMGELVDRLAEGPAARWAETVFAYLRSHDRAPVSSGLAAHAVQDIHARGGRVSVKELARRLCVSERSLERVMREQVGLPAIVVAQIFRLQSALRAMANPGRPLVEVALEAGFYDQSHFVREFRRFVGCTPSQFRDGDFGLTGHFISSGPLEWVG